MKDAALGPGQQLPVVYGLEHIAEEEIDQKVFCLQREAGVEAVRRLGVVGTVEKPREAGRQMFHVAQHHPAGEKRCPGAHPPPHEGQLAR